MPMTPVPASTLLLFHGGPGYVESSLRRRVGTPTAAIAGVTTGLAKFGTSSLDVNSSGLGGLRFPEAAYFGGGRHATLEGWFYLRSYRGTGAWMLTLTGANNDFAVFGIFVNNVGQWAAVTRDSGNNLVSAPAVGGDYRVPVGQWTHLALTYDPAGHERRAYFDGVLRASGSGLTSGAAYTGPTDVCLGGAGAAAMPGPDACFDEVRFVTTTPVYASDFTPAAAEFPDPPPVTEAASAGLIGARRAPLFGQVAAKRLLGARLARDVQDGGRGLIAGTVAERGTPNAPLRRKVWLMNDRDGRVLRETWSNAGTGAYAFPDLDETQRFSVITFDHLLNYRAVIADNLAPTVL